MAPLPPSTSAVYTTSAYSTHPQTAVSPYLPYQSGLPQTHNGSQPPSQQSYGAPAPSHHQQHQHQRIETTQAQSASPSMAHLSSQQHHQALPQHHQSHHMSQRPPVTYSMSAPYQPPINAYAFTSAVSHDNYRRADPTSGGLPSMRTLDHSGLPAAPMGHTPGMMLMGSHHEMGYYNPAHGMIGNPYGMSPDILGRYSMTHDPRFMPRNPKKEIKRRTKTGCMTCRKRRIKCDETHPTCNNCKKSKRECLGYDPIFKQQAQGQPAPHLHNGQSQPQQPSSIKNMSSPSSEHSQQLSQPQLPSPLAQHQPQSQASSQQGQQPHSRPSSQASPLSMPRSLSSSVAPSVSNSMASSGVQSSSNGPLFGHQVQSQHHSQSHHQLAGIPSTQSMSYKNTPSMCVSSSYSTPNSTVVNSSGYDTQSPTTAYDYSASIDPALQSGAGTNGSVNGGGNHVSHGGSGVGSNMGAQPRPGLGMSMYSSSEHIPQPRMVEHLPHIPTA
ncbi:hypothetical protein Cpir12675_000376 [Ceratocystis pirilliformis]|uniref:Zn(2)-C6 fungal-type domain-containing protein n=1 Tax=Ceratocystis pirilliformis TaxID=259994 RepID=A0ABR3ZMP7_9PEZI